jgi:hypothetical protein
VFVRFGLGGEEEIERTNRTFALLSGIQMLLHYGIQFSKIWTQPLGLPDLTIAREGVAATR